MQYPTHKEEFIVRHFAIDSNMRLLLQALCMDMGDAAGNHALNLGFGTEQLAEHGLTWVLAKMRVVMGEMPAMREKFSLETWPTTVEKLQFRRDFIMRDAQEEVFARAVTQWVIMNVHTRKLDRIPEAFVKLRPADPKYAMKDGNIRIAAVENGESGPVFPIRMSDIDHLKHVNNTKYIDFALEAAQVFAEMHQEFSGRPLKQLDIMFRAEARYGDVVASFTSKDRESPDALLHSLMRNGQELARIRTVWG